MDAKKDKVGKAKPGTGKIGMGKPKPAKAGKTVSSGKARKSDKLGKRAKPGTGKIGMGPADRLKK
jgi:hypothetical protein